MLHVLFVKFLLLFKILDRGQDVLAEKADVEERMSCGQRGKEQSTEGMASAKAQAGNRWCVYGTV